MENTIWQYIKEYTQIKSDFFADLINLSNQMGGNSILKNQEPNFRFN